MTEPTQPTGGAAPADGTSRRSCLEFPTPDLLGTTLPDVTVEPAAEVEAWAATTAHRVLGDGAPAEALRDNLLEWAVRAARPDGGRAVFLCLETVDSPTEGPASGTPSPAGAYVTAVLEWDLLAEADDVPTVDEVAGYLSRFEPTMLTLPEVDRVELPAGPGVRVRVLRSAIVPDEDPVAGRGGTSLVEESVVVGVVYPGAGAATVTGTWLALHAGEDMIELVTAAAAAMRVTVTGEDDG